jgi:hypothetical protein
MVNNAIKKKRDWYYYSPPFEHKCLNCGIDIEPSNPSLYCSHKCRLETKHQRDKLNNHFKLATGTIGSISEYRVVAELLGMGFEVFKSVSPHCSCDLIIYDKVDRLCLRVEVKTGTYTGKAKNINYPKKNINADIIAVAFKDKILYEFKGEVKPQCLVKVNQQQWSESDYPMRY